MLKTYRIFYRFLWRYQRRFLLFFLALTLAGVAESIQPYFYKLFIEAIPNQNYRELVTILVIFVSVRFLELGLSSFTYFIGDAFLIPAARDARTAVFKKIQDLDFAFHLSKSTGSLISAIKRGDNAFFSLHHAINISLARIFVSFIVMLTVLSNVNGSLGLLILLSFVINLLWARFLIRNNIKARTDFNESEDEISGIIVDNLINFETVKLFAKETWELARLQREFTPWLKKLWGYANSFRLIDIVVGTFSNLGLFLILLLGLNQMMNLRLSTGDYVMVLGFISSFYPRFFELIYELREVAKHDVDIQKYFDVFDHEEVVKDPRRKVAKSEVAGEIEFENLSFTYPEGRGSAVKNINLKIRSGQSLAFVGHSGAGKTTLVKLLMRFYDPSEGRILIDGIDIKKFTKDQLRSFMGVVPQEPVLFNNTIGYNIAYGADKADEKSIIAAAKMANLHDFIETLPKKYDTEVGERGVKLSGGQKQRLAIARMILSDPDIIIFDEATSQLDSESEKKIQEALWKAARNRTTIIIAHRLSTVTRAEKIVVMEDGEIKEVGSHRALINKKGSIYRRFWRLQSARRKN